MAAFHFIRPWWLLGIPLLLALVWLWRHRRRGNRQWAAVCDPQLLPALLLDLPAQSGSRASGGYLLLGGLLALLALSGPTWERLPQPAFRDMSALVILLDLSASMDAQDIKPSRLIRARYKIEDLLQKRREGQTALVVYAASAFNITPLTDDNATIAAQLPALGTQLMPAQGSRADRALAHARQLLKQSGLRHGDVLLITDGIPAYVMPEVQKELARGGLRLSILGVGTPNGAPIATPQGGFLKDANGNIILPRLDSRPLRQLATAYGGIYQTLSADGHDVARINAWARSHQDRAAQSRRSDRNIQQWRDFGPWLLLPLIPLAALAFRRGVLLLFLFTLLPLPRPAQALDWQGLWQRPDQQAWQALQQGQAKRAAKLFRNPQWQAAARYRAGDYQGALESLKHQDNAPSWYNRGNALAHLGRYRQALKAYERTLALNPDDKDAAYNRKLLEQILKKKKKHQNKATSSGQQPHQGDKAQRSGKHARQKDGKQGRSSAPGQRHPRQKSVPANSDKAKQDQASDGRKPQATGGRKKPRKTPPHPQQADGKQTPSRTPDGQQPEAAREADRDKDEGRLSREQWLRRIPDDPGGLLRRKFRYQYRHQAGKAMSEKQQW